MTLTTGTGTNCGCYCDVTIEVYGNNGIQCTTRNLGESAWDDFEEGKSNFVCSFIKLGKCFHRGYCHLPRFNSWKLPENHIYR